MPLFYVDTTCGSSSASDAFGLSFLSLGDARSHATTLLPTTGTELPMHPGEFKSWTVTVRDDADAVVCRLIMAIINDDLSSGAERTLSRGPKSL